MALELLNRPIPWHAHPRTALDYKSVRVDLTLRIRKTGEVLFMGRVFDDPAEDELVGQARVAQRRSIHEEWFSL